MYNTRKTYQIPLLHIKNDFIINKAKVLENVTTKKKRAKKFINMHTYTNSPQKK